MSKYMPKRTLINRYLLFAGNKDSKPGWDTFVTSSNYFTGMQFSSPVGSTWYQIVDMQSYKVVAEYKE